MAFLGLVFKKFLLEMQYQFGKFRYDMVHCCCYCTVIGAGTKFLTRVMSFLI
jgi:hypothetical protein